MTPVLSIITVTFNCRDLLPRTLESVQEQSFPGIEHVIVDGASTDGTLDLIRAHADRLGSWVSEPDKGIYDAMNKGLHMARGEYVLFLNAGDTFFSKDTVGEVSPRRPARSGRPDRRTLPARRTLLGRRTWPGRRGLLDQRELPARIFIMDRPRSWMPMAGWWGTAACARPNSSTGKVSATACWCATNHSLSGANWPR